jgi:hypothetical protein
MKARTAFIIFACAVLALLAQLILISLSKSYFHFGFSQSPPAVIYYINYFSWLFFVTEGLIIASAVSGIIGTILKKSVSKWLFWGVTIAISLLHIYLLSGMHSY